MNPYEEALQKNIEAGKLANADDLDAKAYQQVFESLRREPDFNLPHHFADRVVAKIIDRKEKKSSSRDFFWFGAGIFSMVVALVVAIAFSGFKPDLGFLAGLAGYKGLLLFGLLFILFLNWLDKKLIRTTSTADHP